MSFIYSYFPSYPIIPFDLCSFISHQHHQLQPTTILISNFQISSDSLPKNDYLNQIIPITAPSFDQLSTSQPKKGVKVQKKPLKKEMNGKKDQNFGWRNQIKDRNVLSGILKGYVQYTISNQKMIKTIENLSKKLGLENGVLSFIRFIAETFPQTKSYVGIKYMKKVLKAEITSKEMRRMLAMTLRFYLREFYPLSVCQGGKLKKKVRLSLLKKVRYIEEVLFNQ